MPPNFPTSPRLGSVIATARVSGTDNDTWLVIGEEDSVLDVGQSSELRVGRLRILKHRINSGVPEVEQVGCLYDGRFLKTADETDMQKGEVDLKLTITRTDGHGPTRCARRET